MSKKLILLLTVIFVFTSSCGVYAENSTELSSEEASQDMTDTEEEYYEYTFYAEDSSAIPPDEQPSDEQPSDAPSIHTSDDKPSDAASPVSSEINIIVLLEERMSVVDSVAVFELYSGSAGELLGRCEEWVGGITKEINMTFDVPEYHTGEKFRLRLVSGLISLTYYADKIGPGGEFELGTYCYNSEDGEIIIGNSFQLSGEPEFKKAVVLYIEGRLQPFSSDAVILDNTTMVPAELTCAALGIKYRYDWEFNSAVCSAGDDMVFFNRDTSYTTAFGNDFYAPHESLYIGDVFYIPVRTLADCFETGIDVYDQYDHIDICLGESQKVRNYLNSFIVNRNGISSRTRNLIWVSKSEYTVRVYEGYQYHWYPVNSFPCGIGAYSSPTVTGQFEYIERISSWDYPNYYVGPVLRFYNGYAIHSTLLNYNGGEYDGTVRAHISHGCVRCHPYDINWLDRTVSLGTRIYITD